MGLLDYSFLLKPQAGDASPHNELNAAQVLAGGTIALVDRGSGDMAWEFTGSNSFAGIDSRTLGVTGATTGGGVTVAVQLEVPVYPAGADIRLINFGSTTDPTATGLQLRKGTANNYMYVTYRDGSSSIGSTTNITIGTTLVTHVFKLSSNDSSGAETNRWWYSSGGAGPGADQSNTLNVSSNHALQYLHVNPAGSGTLRVRRLVVWPAELSDVDCDALRDDIDAALTPPVDTTAPVLTSPTGTQTGSTTATLGATTDEGNGTMYAVVTISATAPSVAQIQAGQNSGGTAAAWAGNQAISSAGAKTFSATGLTASTTYYAHIQHKDAAANNSTVVTSASFTTAAGGGATAVTLTGPSGGVNGVASTNFTAGANGTITGTVIVTPSSGGGGGTFTPSTVSISSGTPTATFTYTPATTGAKTISVTNNGGLTNPSSITYTVTAAPGVLTLPALKNNTGTVLASAAGATAYVYQTSGALVVSKTGQTTNAGGVMTISDAALVAGTQYRVVIVLASGAEGMDKVTAA